LSIHVGRYRGLQFKKTSDFRCRTPRSFWLSAAPPMCGLVSIKKNWSSLEQCRRSRTHRRNQSLPSVRHHVFKSQKYCASLTVFVIKKSSSLHRHQNYRLRSVDSRIYIPLGGGLRSSPVICYHRALSSSVVASIHRRATNRPGCDKLVASMSAALKICTLSAFYAIPRPPTQSTRPITSILLP
jgi:hypothetical protein